MVVAVERTKTSMVAQGLTWYFSELGFRASKILSETLFIYAQAVGVISEDMQLLGRAECTAVHVRAWLHEWRRIRHQTPSSSRTTAR